MRVSNAAQGKIFYGMHFYPGVAEYAEPGQDAYRVFINEDTIRKMNPTFAGKPIFVEHVDEVEDDINELRKDADGWVVESFFNAADGKTWVKFIVVSDRAERAIKNGFRLSNAYIPRNFSNGGLWNGVSYLKEVTDGDFEHLAIVKNPRYEESVIMTPDEFKKYNEDKSIELKRLANSKEKEKSKMKFNLFKRTKVENQKDFDFENMCVTLPKTGKEKTLIQLVNEADEFEEKKKENVADPKAIVKLHDGSTCSVGDLIEKHKSLHDELSALKKDEMEEERDLETEDSPVDVEGDLHNEEEEDEQESAKKNALESEDELEAAKKKKNASATKKKIPTDKSKHFESLRNAHVNVDDETARVDLMDDQVQRGRARYGSA